MNDDEFNAADAGIDHVTVIPGGIHNDLKLCLQQALEYLETGEHDGGWVALKTIDVECALELVEDVVDYCGRELPQTAATCTDYCLSADLLHRLGRGSVFRKASSGCSSGLMTLPDKDGNAHFHRIRTIGARDGGTDNIDE
jgi:hypothetical protein